MATLICGAIEEEINFLKEKENSTFIVKKLGIGLIDSAVSIAHILREYKSINRVIFTGTAGAYPNSGLTIGDVVNATSHELIGVGEILNLSYFPKLIKKHIEMEDLFNGSYRNVKCASVLEITKNTELAAKIENRTQSQIEHMELFSIARVCDEFNIPFNGIVGIANNVGIHSHDEWVKNGNNVAKMAQKLLIQTLAL